MSKRALCVNTIRVKRALRVDFIFDKGALSVKRALCVFIIFVKRALRVDDILDKRDRHIVVINAKTDRHTDMIYDKKNLGIDCMHDTRAVQVSMEGYSRQGHFYLACTNTHKHTKTRTNTHTCESIYERVPKE